MKTTLILLSLLVLLTSCDPAKKLAIENKLSTESSITFYFTGKAGHKFEGFWQEAPLKITLAPQATKAYTFGLGTWKMNNALDSLVVRVEKVVIETSKSSELFSGKKQVKSFFRDRIVDDRYRATINIIIN